MVGVAVRVVVGVAVGVSVAVDVDVGVSVAVDVGVSVDVAVSVGVAVSVAVGVADPNVTPGGRSSVTTTLVASFGPRLLATTAYVSVEPGRTGSGESDTPIAKSARTMPTSPW